MSNELEVFDRIVAIHEEAGIDVDRMDLGITLYKMTEVQREDLLAMMDYFAGTGETVEYIIGNVRHDLNGLKAGFMGLSAGIGFSPRSSGYSK